MSAHLFDIGCDRYVQVMGSYPASYCIYPTAHLILLTLVYLVESDPILKFDLSCTRPLHAPETCPLTHVLMYVLIGNFV